MPCLPESGDCERLFTDEIVAHLNNTEGTHYEHRACLDVADSTTAQPEALYVDSRTGQRLVIERKSISWPSDYAYRHQNDHAVGEIFTTGLIDLATDDLYEINLPLLMEGKSRDLLSYAANAVGTIRSRWQEVLSGSQLRGSAGENWWWGFRKLPPYERDEDAPETGIMVTYTGPMLSFLDGLDPADLPTTLRAAIDKIYGNVSAKFSAYQDSRRLLLLDPQGDLQDEDADWWRQVWDNVPPPAGIVEIWTGAYHWVTDDTQNRFFERVYPSDSITPSVTEQKEHA